MPTEIERFQLTTSNEEKQKDRNLNEESFNFRLWVASTMWVHFLPFHFLPRNHTPYVVGIQYLCTCMMSLRKCGFECQIYEDLVRMGLFLGILLHLSVQKQKFIICTSVVALIAGTPDSQCWKNVLTATLNYNMAPNKADIWKYFLKVSGDVARCSICRKRLKTGGGTTNMRRHIVTTHPKYEKVNIHISK